MRPSVGSKNFLIRVTTAFLKPHGPELSSNEQLTNLVIGGKMIAIQSFTRKEKDVMYNSPSYPTNLKTPVFFGKYTFMVLIAPLFCYLSGLLRAVSESGPLTCGNRLLKRAA